MNNKTAKQLLNAYRIKAALIGVLYVVALLALFWVMTKSTFVGIAGIVVLGASLRAPFEKIRENDLESVIYEDLDPQKFNELLELGAFKRHFRFRVLAAMCLGDYDKVLSLVEQSEKKTDNPLEKCNNLYRRGYVYFERGEFDKLPAVVKEFNKLKGQHPKLSQIFNSFSVFDKYDAFSDDDFEYVVEVCDIDLAENDPKKQNHKLTKINVSFYRAVSLYKLGENDKARAAFREIIEYAPKMHKANLAAEYLEKLN